jgi:putative ABC transport system permease protein
MSLWQDVRYALRSMRQNPGLTAIAVLALALGMGANTAIFSVVNAVLLNSAPLRGLRQPSRLVMVWESNPQMMEFLKERMPVALGNFQEWRRQSHSFEGMAAFLSTNCNIGARSAGDRPERVDAIQADPALFPLLGVHPAVGRVFTSDEARTAADRVVMVSADLYRRRFGNDTNLAGRTIRVDGVDRSIIGIMPAGFELPALWEGFDQKKADVWMPLDPNATKGEQETWARLYLVYGRLRPGVTLASARSEMTVIANRVRLAHPEPDKGFGVNVFPLADEDVGPDMRRALLVLQIAVGFVLLIACANVANLLLARAVGREREIAIRLALGARRRQIVRMLLTESLLLSLIGAAVGSILVVWGMSAITALAPPDVHGFHELRLDPLVLGFTFAVSVLTGLIFGLAPALHGTRANLNESLSQGGRSISSGPQWMRNSMVVGQVALALMLLAGAGLMIRSLSVLMNVDLGFRADHLLTTQINLLNPSDTAGVHAFCDRLLDGVEHLPGVLSASMSTGMPMESVSESNYDIEGAPPKPEGWRIAGINNVSEGFFRTMRIPVRVGRDFTRADAEAKQPTVAIVTDSFARGNWPSESALGKVVRFQDRRFNIVGIAGDTHQLGPDAAMRPEVYVPARDFSSINLAVRTAGDPAALGPAVRRLVWSIDPQQPVERMRPMEGELHSWLAPRRFNMTILGVFAGLALVLASLGLYGVLAYVVTLRTRELGIRVALGADRAALLRLVIGQGTRLVLIGVALGLAAAFALTRFMSSLLFGVSTVDPLTFAIVPAVLIAVALVASYIPARRASRVDPMQALRAE